MKDSDERYTPGWLANVGHGFAGGRIDLDVCTNRANWMGARRFYTARGLQRPWRVAGRRRCVVWCNPPYSVGQVILWATRAYEQRRSNRVEVLMLVQADVSTGWFRFLRSHMDSVAFLCRRVGFVHPDGSQMPGAKFGSALFYFGPYRAKFRRHLEADDLAWVVDRENARDERSHALPTRRRRSALALSSG